MSQSTALKALAIGFIASLICGMPALADEARPRPRSPNFLEKKPPPPQVVDMTEYDDVLKLQCDEQKNYLTFSGSKLKPIVRVRVTYHRDTRYNRYAPEAKFEDLWYRNSLPIASKRFIPLPIKDGDDIAIVLKPNATNFSEPEIAACANALARLRLEASLNRNLLVAVFVPDYIFDKLIAELDKQNFVPCNQFGQYASTLIPIPLVTELGRRQMLTHLPPAKRAEAIAEQSSAE